VFARGVLGGSGEELLRLFAREGADLDFRESGLTVVAAESKGGVGGDQAVVHCLRQDATQSAADVLDRLGAQSAAGAFAAGLALRGLCAVTLRSSKLRLRFRLPARSDQGATVGASEQEELDRARAARGIEGVRALGIVEQRVGYCGMRGIC
jgi:hypothetical protein